MEYVFPLDYKFPKDKLLVEFDNLFDKKIEIQEPDSKRFSGFWLLFANDVTKKIAKDFLDYYNLPFDKYIVNFLYVEPNGILPWHIDQGGSISAINCILTPDPVPIEFKTVKYIYDTALIDISSLHQVMNDNQSRKVFRITFQNEEATYMKVKEILCQKL